MGAIFSNPIVINLIVAVVTGLAGHISGWFHHKHVATKAALAQAATANQVPPPLATP